MKYSKILLCMTVLVCLAVSGIRTGPPRRRFQWQLNGI